MADINHRERTVRLKLVYYGPAVGGKTTNLMILHDRALGSRRGQFVSVNSQQDRTILCDLLPLRSGGFRGYDLKLQLVAVPGQAQYVLTRRIVLKGADAIVFVANSAVDRYQENLQSFDEMTINLQLHQLDPSTIPLVLQYNKRDLPAVTEIETLSRALNARHVPEFPAVAMNGEGVLETFSSILTQAIRSVSRNYSMLGLPPGQTIEDWTAQAVQGMFGRTRLDEPPEDEIVEPGELGLELEEAIGEPAVLPEDPLRHLKVRIPMPEDVPRAGTASADVRSAESLAETYAEASAELGFVVSDLREERDLAKVRLEQVRRALELATEGPGVTDIESRVRRILEVLLEAGGASGATLRLKAADTAQILTLPPLTGDPLSRTTAGASHLEQVDDLAEPRLDEVSELPEIAEALRSGQPSFEAVGLVPLRSAERLLGLALLYYGAYAVLPARDGLLHLGFLGRVLAGPLEAFAAREATSTADRLKVLSRASAAAVASLLARLSTDAARRQRLRLADVLGALQAPGVAVHVDPPTLEATGDAPLLRFAFATLIRQCETDALERGQSPEISIRAAAEGGKLRVRVTGGGRASVISSPEAGPDIADAEMSVVNAIVALHGGVLVAGRSESMAPHFTVELVAPQRVPAVLRPQV
jgi:hypothetical protein